MHGLADAAAADDGDGRARAATSAVLSAAPTPVVTPQPISASWSSGTLVSILTIDDSSHVIVSANVPRPVIVV